MLTLLSGLAAGSAHVVSGPDHLAALAPLAVNDPRRALWTGARWGVGHGLGVIVLAAIGQLAKELVAVEQVSAISELIVGVLLVAIGFWAFRRASRIVIHSHGHHHDEGDDAHAHLHVHTSMNRHEQPEAHARHSHAAFWVGLLHGAAGTGHLLGVLPSLALSPVEAAIYVGAYIVAATASMALFGLLLGTITRRGGLRAIRAMLYVTAAAAVCVGVVWVGMAWPTA